MSSASLWCQSYDLIGTKEFGAGCDDAFARLEPAIDHDVFRLVSGNRDWFQRNGRGLGIHDPDGRLARERR